ncbi:MAG: MafI family immunity protein [Candidatus Methylacidiphilales bacterium]|nr:MafI family immunity protein [Candidatus Methylacidiphilales bacterium]
MSCHVEKMETELLSLLSCFDGRLPLQDYEDVRDLIVHREWGVGLETLCQQLDEYEIAPSPAELLKIRELADEMLMPVDTWSFLDKAHPG